MTKANTTYAELNAVLDQARHKPAATLRSLPVSDEQLVRLQHRWTTILSARLDNAIEFAGSEPLTDPVAAAWRQLAADQKELRALLDAKESESTSLAGSLDREFRMLAMAAGLIGVDDRSDEAVRIGRSLRDLIRAGHTNLDQELVQA
ncbi:hypothetical protein [Pseudonocardia spinosispora]|uniref:hypothetical protein n=1 Tax=Pseudonocardia spinosispora TaxID=103441 RepID=UPI00040D6EDB|nr:hypothetical protein [Pseudonocardia spinosispora]